jgi:hypothetical protein
MPRLRRSARERRLQPRLDADIWAWLQSGRPDKAKLALRTRIAIFALEGAPTHKWQCSRDPNYRPNRRAMFWDAIEAKVLRGELEVADDVEHNARDLALATEEEALNEFLM